MRFSRIARRFQSCAPDGVRGRLQEPEGGALIETALVLPLFFLLLFGVAEFAAAAYTAIEVSNAAIAGVQYGAQSASTSGDTNGIQNAAANDAPNITLTTTPSHTCICSNGNASTCLSTDCSGSHIETILTVQTQTTFKPWFSFPGLPKSITISEQAVQKVLQ